MDHQRWLALGSLSAGSEAERGEPAPFRRAVFSVCGSGFTRFLRSDISDAVLRKYSAFQFAQCNRAEPRHLAVAGPAFSGGLLRSRSEQRFVRPTEGRCEYLSPFGARLRR